MNHTQPIFARNAKPVEIVGVACGEGAQDKRCDAGPDALREGELVSRLESHGLSVAWRETIHPILAGHGDSFQAVLGVCRRLAPRVQSIVTHGSLPLVVGGDHSCAIGTWKGVVSALRSRGPLGLIWIDAHMDAHTPRTTPSSALHGMPLACLFGCGDKRLTSLADSALLLPQHVCLIGVRSFESGEAALLRRLGVRVFFMPEVARRGIGTVMREALAIATTGTAGFGVTLDLDALDPKDAPGVGSPVKGGIRAAELTTALAQLQGHPALAGLEIVEYNPRRDRDGVTAHVAAGILEAILAAKPEVAGACDRVQPQLMLLKSKRRLLKEPQRNSDKAKAA